MHYARESMDKLRMYTIILNYFIKSSISLPVKSEDIITEFIMNIESCGAYLASV